MGRILWLPAVQVLLDEVVDLRGALGWQGVDELVDRFGAVRIAVVDGLGACHGPSMAAGSDNQE